jgi:hypothetical protein
VAVASLTDLPRPCEPLESEYQGLTSVDCRNFIIGVVLLSTPKAKRMELELEEVFNLEGAGFPFLVSFFLPTEGLGLALVGESFMGLPLTNLAVGLVVGLAVAMVVVTVVAAVVGAGAGAGGAAAGAVVVVVVVVDLVDLVAFAPSLSEASAGNFGVFATGTDAGMANGGGGAAKGRSGTADLDSGIAMLSAGFFALCSLGALASSGRLTSDDIKWKEWEVVSKRIDRGRRYISKTIEFSMPGLCEPMNRPFFFFTTGYVADLFPAFSG